MQGLAEQAPKHGEGGGDLRVDRREARRFERAHARRDAGKVPHDHERQDEGYGDLDRKARDGGDEGGGDGDGGVGVASQHALQDLTG